jgi:multidrug efflux pump subunit AcrB
MGMNLTMPSIIGALGLAGVVINDGIIMMTYLKKAKNLEEVMIRATKRFRPIILTTVTTLVGLSSLIFFPTGQAVIFQPLAVSLGFGLLWGTILNLIYLPVIYSFARNKQLNNRYLSY